MRAKTGQLLALGASLAFVLLFLGEGWAFIRANSPPYDEAPHLTAGYSYYSRGDFRLMSRPAVDALCAVREQNRFMKGLFAWVGFRQYALKYQRDARLAGTSKWSWWRLISLAMEGIISFSSAPLQIATWLGVFVATFAFIYGGFRIVDTLLRGNPVAGYPSLMVVILFLGGVQLITLGIIGEYIGRIYQETKRRPLYVVRKRYDDAAPS